MPCLFCESASGDLPQAVVYEDREVIAFLDWRQTVPGHVLVLPRRHVSAEVLFDGAAGSAGLMAAVLRVAAAVRDATEADGVQMGAILYPGTGASRASGRVPGPRDATPETAEDGHFHVHVLPRQMDGQIARIYPFGDELSGRASLERIAATIRAAMEDNGRVHA